jgi:glycosyltransferase involved in cell wall biosynthesis
VRDVAARDQRIKPLLEFIPDDRVAELFGAADAAIAPRQDGGTSGALILALSMGLGAVAAAVPIYEELSAGDAAAWLFSPYDTESLLAALEAAAADPAGARRRGTAGRQLMQPHSWDEMGRRTARLLTAAVEPGRSQSPEPAPEHA